MRARYSQTTVRRKHRDGTPPSLLWGDGGPDGVLQSSPLHVRPTTFGDVFPAIDRPDMRRVSIAIRAADPKLRVRVLLSGIRQENGRELHACLRRVCIGDGRERYGRVGQIELCGTAVAARASTIMVSALKDVLSRAVQ